MRGDLTFESRTPDTAAVAYAKLLGDVLRDAPPRQLDVHGSRVFVRDGFFRLVSNWHLLVGVTSATSRGQKILAGPAAVPMRSAAPTSATPAHVVSSTTSN